MVDFAGKLMRADNCKFVYINLNVFLKEAKF